MKIKKMILGAFLGVFTLAGVAVLPNQANAQSEGDKWANPSANQSHLTDSGQELTGSAFLDTIQTAINWLLGMLATIALVICLYGGFLMVTAAGDAKKYEKGLEVLKYAGIGLAIIGLSWMIVSVIFWFVGTLSGDNQTAGQQTTTSTDRQGSVYRDGAAGGEVNE